MIAQEDKRVRSISAVEDLLSRQSRERMTPSRLPGSGRLLRALPRRTLIRATGDFAILTATAAAILLTATEAWYSAALFGGFNIVYLLALHISGLYSFGELREGRLVYFLRFSAAFFAGSLLVLPVSLVGGVAVKAGMHAASSFVLLVLWRMLIERKLVLPPVKVVVAGAGAAGTSFVTELREHPEFELIGVFDDAAENPGLDGVPVSGDCRDLALHAVKSDAQLVVVAITHSKRSELVDSLLACQYAGIPVLDMPTAFELLTGRLPLVHCSQHWVAFSGNIFENHSAVSQRVKRALDVVLATIGLLLSGPVIMLAALAVRLESRGPGMFRQVRVGRFGRHFTILKLRTMRSDAEDGTGAVWAAKNDPRVTRVGRVLRFLRLDELPQFWNVLMGEMSIVGPRPERPEFVQHLSEVVPFYGLRHGVRPGITGWAQVCYPYGASEADALRKLEYDLFYVRHYSLLFDVRIMLKTARVMLFGTGSS